MHTVESELVLPVTLHDDNFERSQEALELLVAHLRAVRDAYNKAIREHGKHYYADTPPQLPAPDPDSSHDECERWSTLLFEPARSRLSPKLRKRLAARFCKRLRRAMQHSPSGIPEPPRMFFGGYLPLPLDQLTLSHPSPSLFLFEFSVYLHSPNASVSVNPLSKIPFYEKKILLRVRRTPEPDSLSRKNLELLFAQEAPLLNAHLEEHKNTLTLHLLTALPVPND